MQRCIYLHIATKSYDNDTEVRLLYKHMSRKCVQFPPCTHHQEQQKQKKKEGRSTKEMKDGKCMI